MRHTIHFVASLAAAAAFAVTPALAECKRFGFTVNDYGKDGPTKDAKDLLDKLITKTMADKGVKDYSTGKKSVSCELFLNFIVFDEHTCTAEASVCWGGSALPSSEKADASDDSEAKTKSASDEDVAPKPAKKKKKDAVAAVSKADSADAKKPSETSSNDKPAAEKAPPAEKAAAVEHHKKSTNTQVADPKPSAKPAVKEAAKTPEASATPASTETASKPETDAKSEAVKADDKASAAKSEPVKAEDVGTIPQAQTASTTDGAGEKKPSEKSAKSPVVTGSISEPAKKPAKHKTEKAPAPSDDGIEAAPSSKSSDGDAGYPTPLPPQPGDIPAQ